MRICEIYCIANDLLNLPTHLDLPRWEGFEVRVIEPPATSQRLKRSQYPTQDFPLGRQTGRSLHMIVASYPKMASPQSCESRTSISLSYYLPC
jgi:hypothetical protein